MVRVAFVTVLVLFGLTRLNIARGFPSEDEFNSQMRFGMTVGEVIDLYGQPANQVAFRDGSFKLHYVAPVGNLTAERDGPIGFELHFVDGKVADWQVFRGNPSFEPMRPPLEFKWLLQIFLALGLLATIARVVYRRQSEKDESHELLNAYARRQFNTKRLPEFRFITRDVTLEEVEKKLGLPTRTKELSFESVVGPEKAAAYGVSGLLIQMSEYDLPYGAAVIVMPEYPCRPQDKIRAVFYRQPQPDEESG